MASPKKKRLLPPKPLQQEIFREALDKLRKKFPMCYIEAWTPEDFQTEWNSDDSLRVAGALEDGFDANIGTHWDRIAAEKQYLGITTNEVIFQ